MSKLLYRDVITDAVIGPDEFKKAGSEETPTHYVTLNGENVGLVATGRRVSEPIQTEEAVANFTLTKILTRVSTHLLSSAFDYSRAVNKHSFSVFTMGGGIKFTGDRHFRITGLQFADVPADVVGAYTSQVGVQVTVGITWSKEQWTPVVRGAEFSDDTGAKGTIYLPTETPYEYTQNVMYEMDFGKLFNGVLK